MKNIAASGKHLVDPKGDEDVSRDSSVLLEAASRLRAADPKIVGRALLLEAMVNHVPDFMYAKDRDGRFLYANQAIIQGNDLSSVDDIIGLTDFDLHGEAATDARISEIEQRVMETGEPDLGYDERAMRGGGDRWLMMSRVPLRDSSGAIVGIVGSSRDISARKASERLMRAQNRILEMIVGSVAIPELMNTLAELIEELAEGIRCAAVAFPPEDGIQIFKAPNAPDLLLPLFEALSASSSTPIREATARTAFENSGFLCFEIPSANGTSHGLIGISSTKNDLSRSLTEFLAGASRMAGIAIDRRRAEQQIRFLLVHDALTGLENRTSLEGKLPGILKAAELSSQQVAVSFLDLDNFKQINDTFGHAVGDELLKEASGRLSSLITGKDIVARIGGDEFVLVLHETDERFEDRLQRIKTTVAQPLTLQGLDLKVSCSIGVAYYPSHGLMASDLFRAADLAMYKAKENGRDAVQAFSQELSDSARRKFLRAEELRTAIQNDEFVLDFQPQINLTTGLVSGVEALVRWKHPVEGILPPSEFIPLAEETGIIIELGEAVLRKACQQAKKWSMNARHRVRVSVNMSPKQFQNAGVIDHVKAALKESGLDPSLLEIEITESSIMRDIGSAAGIMKELTDMGVDFAIDDFGTSYSCLNMLKKLPFSRLKIDRSFIMNTPDDEQDCAIVTAILNLARSLKLQVVAEGVETIEQAQFLHLAGCEHGQGYFYSRPVGDLTIEALLDKQY
ncbi:putative bifunctional diguanylate cyclase/phosphodiesterase [Pararhizobium antarcticum]|uniref:Diguanylate cyclase n=1 Tax=Pararhizobium antarcticum TaxID=1798805 RepID=A0A657LZ80_9HYPH|nr:GGDEF and EAL domain-containing protein [Pararhizobium antarcticum]OJG00683.1 diguanylate cyclase [Rhizobium sp. 58]OJG00924.1 diguanylate cyclase [Pararhizobium antarcticum]